MTATASPYVCPHCHKRDPNCPRTNDEQVAEIARLRSEVVRVGILHGQALIERDALREKFERESG